MNNPQLHQFQNSFAFSTSRWDFRTHNNDIKFGVRAVNQKTGEKFSEVELKKVLENESEETGFITCLPNHQCKWSFQPDFPFFLQLTFILDIVVFDNSYSYFKSKKITYSVVMMDTPISEIEKSASKIEEKIFDQNENDVRLDQLQEKDINWLKICSLISFIHRLPYFL